MAARQGFGILVFSILVIMYAAKFWTVAAREEGRLGRRQERDNIAEAGPSVLNQMNKKEGQKLSVHTISRLPGSVGSNSKIFEGATNIGGTVGRVETNLLPGAIGLSGPFDNEGIDGEAPLAAIRHEPTAVPGGGTPSTAPSQPSPNADVTTTSPVTSAAETSTATSGTAAAPARSHSQVSSNAHESPSADKAAPLDEANVVRDGLGHIIPQRKKGKRREKKKRGLTTAKKLRKSTRKEAFEEAGTSTADSDAPADSGSADDSKSDTSIPESDAGGTEAGYEPKPPPGEDVSSISMPPVAAGEHPMSRTFTELQVEGETGTMKAPAIKKAYKKLVKAYLKPFEKGIQRRAFFDILRRKNYSLAPPESNKGIQTILLQIINKRIYMLDPYEVAKHSKAFYRSRIKEMIWLIAKVAKERDTPDTEFLVAIHDCVQTVSKKHTYRGAHYKESSPTFTIVACNFSDNVPFPMWEGDEQRGGGLRGWNVKMKEYGESHTGSWADKKDQAVFRGGYRASMYFGEKKEAFSRCDDVGRSRLAYLAQENPELYDVSIGGKCGKKGHTMSRLSEKEHHSFKYILYAEGNCFWADRLNKQVFGPSAIIKQETPCGQFWEPLLRPMTHYIPTDFFFTDTTERITWANENSDEAEKIVKNANEFAHNFLSLNGIESYVEVLLREYTKLLKVKHVQMERGSIEVTNGKFADEQELD